MAKKKFSFLNFVIWLAGILVSLTVAFAVASGTLAIPFIPVIITKIAGWAIVVLVVLGVLFKLISLIK